MGEAREKLTRCHQCHGKGTIGDTGNQQLEYYHINDATSINEIISNLEDEVRLFQKVKCKRAQVQKKVVKGLNELISNLEDEIREFTELKCKTCDGTGTGDLAHFYRGRFEQEPPGVEVTGAGEDAVNGWYAQKEAAEGPPRAWPEHNTAQYFTQQTAGRHWYEKDDGHFIYPQDDGMYW